VLVKGKIVRAIPLTAAEAWVTAELIHFGGVVVACEVEVKGARLAAVSVHSPAWPVDRERLTDVSVGSVKLTQSPDVWVADLLLAALRSRDVLGLLIAGCDFNLCEPFDAWKGGPRGNREYLDRMVALGFVDCLRRVQGRLAPTFCKPGARQATAQIDHLFGDADLARRLVDCRADPGVVFGAKLSDHLPVVADFSWSEQRSASSSGTE
jgi:endonuclease/exonuclease/phosphatase family metal-dependent hydrolase